MIDNNSLFLLALFVGLITLIVAPFGIITAHRTKMRRDYEAVIELGDSAFLKTLDGSILIRKRTYRNWGLVLFFGSIIGGFALVGIRLVIAALSGKGSLLGTFICVGFIALIIAVVAVFFILALKTLPKKTFRFDAKTNTLERHEASETQLIPFRRLGRLSTDKVISGYKLVIELEDSDDLLLAVVSGAGARKKSDQAVSWVQDALRSGNTK